MASLQASSLIFSSHYPKVYGHLRSSVNAAIHIPKLSKTSFSSASRGNAGKDLLEELQLRDVFVKPTPSLQKYFVDHNNQEATGSGDDNVTGNFAKAKLYVILEAVADRVEMHKNIGEQRDNWNVLLLNSINMITLSASTMAGVAASACGSGSSAFALNTASALLFSAATGMLIIMNKIQPSQLAEEQRNATRLLKELYSEIQTKLALYEPTEMDVKDAMKKVLALDKAFPLPLLGKMIEKFPAKFEPATWWPNKSLQRRNTTKLEREVNDNKWNRKLEEVMREVKHVINNKDSEEYMKLGNLALKVNKMLAISGPLLTGIAAASSAFAGNGALAIVAATAGTLATVVNTLEHGAQIGMVIEMYRNCGGFFNNMDESIDSMLKENSEEREDGEVFEMKVAMKLGRSLSELRDLAKKSSSSRMEGIAVQEFASQLF